jgi:HSP20 family protein
MKNVIPWRKNKHSDVPSVWDDDWLEGKGENPFEELFAPMTRTFSSRMPSVDVSEDKNEITVKAEIPGMTEKDIDLSWHNGILRVRGEKREEKEEKKRDRYYSECRYGRFCRDIPLGESVDWQRAKAKYKNGVLTVNVPKTEHARKAIEITVS